MKVAKLEVLKRDVRVCLEAGRRILFTDECLFSFGTMARKAFAPKGSNITLDQSKIRPTTIALVASVSEEKGLEHFAMFRRAVNSDSFIEFLNGLNSKVPGEDGDLILDNLRVHHAHKVQRALSEARRRCIFLPPYSPELNAIELFWSVVKARFRKLRL